MMITRDQEEALNDPFPVVCLHRSDIKEWFRLTELEALKIDDYEMRNLAVRLAEAYCERIFWMDLDVMAEDVVRSIKA